MELRLLVISIYLIRKKFAHRLKRAAKLVSLRRLFMIKKSNAWSIVARKYRYRGCTTI